MADIIGNDDAPPSAVASSLEQQIKARVGSHIRQLRVTCQDDGVILQGIAVTFYAKQLAQHLVRQVTDLPILANQIEVC